MPKYQVEVLIELQQELEDAARDFTSGRGSDSAAKNLRQAAHAYVEYARSMEGK